ncbi:hypothetical protein GOB14_32755, partial [Sinorhizobium meliloti]|nr:hypothetical protein [Sinorhizobium meliloti]
RGRLFLGIGGRDHFGIRGRIASEFAVNANLSSEVDKDAHGDPASPAVFTLSMPLPKVPK